MAFGTFVDVGLGSSVRGKKGGKCVSNDALLPLPHKEPMGAHVRVQVVAVEGEQQGQKLRVRVRRAPQCDRCGGHGHIGSDVWCPNAPEWRVKGRSELHTGRTRAGLRCQKLKSSCKAKAQAPAAATRAADDDAAAATTAAVAAPKPAASQRLVVAFVGQAQPAAAAPSKSQSRRNRRKAGKAAKDAKDAAATSAVAADPVADASRAVIDTLLHSVKMRRGGRKAEEAQGKALAFNIANDFPAVGTAPSCATAVVGAAAAPRAAPAAAPAAPAAPAAAPAMPGPEKALALMLAAHDEQMEQMRRFEAQMADTRASMAAQLDAMRASAADSG